MYLELGIVKTLRGQDNNCLALQQNNGPIKEAGGFHDFN